MFVGNVDILGYPVVVSIFFSFHRRKFHCCVGFVVFCFRVVSVGFWLNYCFLSGFYEVYLWVLLFVLLVSVVLGGVVFVFFSADFGLYCRMCRCFMVFLVVRWYCVGAYKVDCYVLRWSCSAALIWVRCFGMIIPQPLREAYLVLRKSLVEL